MAAAELLRSFLERHVAPRSREELSPLRALLQRQRGGPWTAALRGARVRAQLGASVASECCVAGPQFHRATPPTVEIISASRAGAWLALAVRAAPPCLQVLPLPRLRRLPSQVRSAPAAAHTPVALTRQRPLPSRRPRSVNRAGPSGSPRRPP